MPPCRTVRGNILLEKTPLLVIVSALFVLPAVDLLGIAYDYTSCFTLNDLQTQHAATLPAEQAENPDGFVKKEIPENWRRTGLGAFVNLAGAPETDVKFACELSATPKNINSSPPFVLVRTTMKVQPVLRLPLNLSLPGFNRPIAIDISNRRLLNSRHFAHSAIKTPSAG